MPRLTGDRLADVGWLAVGLIVGALLASALSASLVPALGSVGGDDDVTVDRSNLTLPAGVDRLHERGVTGSDVTVGVIDATGFDPGHPALRDSVVAARSFGRGNTVENGGVNAHGTAAAVTVAATAPDADLLVANADSPESARRAVAWLVDRDVDVVVLQFSRLGAPDDGTAPLSRAATKARQSGVVVVAPTGNLARGHWEGPFRPGDDGTHRFPDGPRNELRPLGSSREGPAGQASLWLTWDGDVDLRMTLYRVTPAGPERVAVSEPVRDRRVSTERIRTNLRTGTHFVTVTAQDGSAVERARDTALELQSPTHEFDQASPNGSLAAPATAHGVFAVGGYDAATETVTAESGRGPTADGRRGVDVVAPVGLWERWPGTGSAGTSVAAAYAGGTAALALDVDSSLAPGHVERSLAAAAEPVGPATTDRRAGHGRLNPVGSVERVSSTPNATGDRALFPGARGERSATVAAGSLLDSTGGWVGGTNRAPRSTYSITLTLGAPLLAVALGARELRLSKRRRHDR